MVSIDIRDMIFTSHKGLTIENRKGIVKFTIFYSVDRKVKDAYTLKYDMKTNTFIWKYYKNTRLKESQQIPLNIPELIENGFNHTAVHAIADAYSQLVWNSSLGGYVTSAYSYCRSDIAHLLSAPIGTQNGTCAKFKLVMNDFIEDVVQACKDQNKEED